jgi:uncharacterized protein YkwD
LRKIAVAVLAVPVLVLIYAPVVLQRSVLSRVGTGLGVGAILWIAAFGSTFSGRTEAVPLSVAQPVAAAHFSDVSYQHGLHDPVSVTFESPMDRASVEAALSVTPAARVSLSWSADSRVLTVSPASGWSTGTYYTIAIAQDARTATGQQVAEPSRAAFLTRAPTRAMVIADRRAGDRVTTTTSFTVAFERTVDLTSAEAAFQIEPTVAGAFTTPGDSAGAGFSFVPSEPLAADTTYSVSLRQGIVDADGAAVVAPRALQVRTAVSPDVVRFRPVNGATKVPREAIISVRFTTAMDRRSTARALAVTADGQPRTGKISWVERGTVLVFEPASKLPYSATMKVSIDTTARSRAGTPLAAPRSGAFKVESNPTKPKPAARTGTVRISRSVGGTAGRATWYAVEVYYLRLMNCTRTGGWVTSTGACSSPGGLSTPPIVLDAGISNRVSRPYARLLATRNICSHFADGDPTTRLRRAGYSGWAAENIGCRSASNAYASVLGTHLYYQTEKPCSGFCHYANLMNPAYKRCGIGVWVYGGRIRLVVDFYHP